ncbi:MAG: rod shape-determining protein RodA [Spirochaetes bacterium]|nr:rod shape-determining protein RodA [Spirochaetota bacterium]
MSIIEIGPVFKRTDWLIIALSTSLTVIGIMFIYSSGINSVGLLVSDEYKKQIFWAILGFILLIITLLVKPKILMDYAFWIYLGFIVLLIYTRIAGRVVNGSRSWIGIGSYGIQPSEFAKVATIIFLSKYLSATKHEPNTFKRFLLSVLIAGIPFLLILAQPDFGTAMVYIPIYLFIAFFLGINGKYLAFTVGVSATSILFVLLPLWQNLIREEPINILRIFYEAPYVYYLFALLSVVFILALLGHIYFKKRYYYWILFSIIIIFIGLILGLAAGKILKEYQMMRLIVFFDPNIDPLGSGWHILQSLTAIGSGGLGGKGFLLGTHSHYRYLPTQSTDFIFSIISEELGFIGVLLINLLFLVLLFRIYMIMKSTKDMFSLGICSGVSSLLIFHYIVNVGMTIGIMPITGIPLWFLSYGGSALLTINIALGLVLAIGSRR